MNALTLGQARDTISRVEGVCRDSNKVRSLLNEAQSRLLNRSDKPVGSLVRFRSCVGSSNCLTLARQIQSIEAYALCNTPGTIRPGEWEFIGYPNGNGLAGNHSYSGQVMIDRGTSCAFDDVGASTTSPKKIALIATNAVDAGKKVVLRYIDSNGNKVYTSIGGTVQEGEQLTLLAPPGIVYTASNVATQGLYQVNKEVTQYPILMYEVYSPSLTISKMLAKYEPSEEVPIYRRYFVPGLTDRQACCSETSSDCTVNKSITCLVKLQHVPVVVDNDPLVIGNIAALKLMVMAIMREESNRLDESAIFEQKARAEIDGELSSYLGDGMRSSIRMEGDFGAGVACVGQYGWGGWY